MSDIIFRLSSPAAVFYEYAADNGKLLRDAADEIERLRADLASVTAELEMANKRMAELFSAQTSVSESHVLKDKHE